MMYICIIAFLYPFFLLSPIFSTGLAGTSESRVEQETRLETNDTLNLMNFRQTTLASDVLFARVAAGHPLFRHSLSISHGLGV
jgi:hypothetical protein